MKKDHCATTTLAPRRTPDQKRRLALLTIFVVREMRSAVDQHREWFEEDEEE